MKLIVAVVQGNDGDALLDGLTSRGYRATRISSAGGFLRESNVTLLIGVSESYVVDVLRIIREHCHSRVRFVNPLMPIMEPGEFYMANPVEVVVGGATVFVLAVERYERIA
ncbi:MAG: cyclic-di-AMP receptor [Chloroflexia bacterium]|nr:cyclic-di-AMP receptor [Chloroflexia bacterium]